MSQQSFQDKNVLVTGGSSGIGLELVRLFLKEKARVIIVASNAAKLEATVQNLKKEFSVEVVSIAKDLSSASAPQEVAQFLRSKNIEPDVLVNSAGFGVFGNFHEVSAEKSIQMVDVNVRALVELTGIFLPGMVARRKGWVLNLASTAAFQAIPTESIYAASKAFVLSFSEGIAEEVLGTGVKITCLCPGATDTPFFKRGDIHASRSMRRHMMSSATVAKIGLEALKKGKPLVVAGISNKIIQFLERLSPRQITTKLAKRMVQ